MRFTKHSVFISLVLFAAVAYAPASHLIAHDADSCVPCPSNLTISIQ
ncbi:MAG TPA: hypothetical protein VHN81_11280 [Edaphobacter sp.]|nr:hypothetical protein [Edaphobacter sp.]